MFRWVPNLKNWMESLNNPTPAKDVALGEASFVNDEVPGSPNNSIRILWWVRFLPFFLSALFFLSGLFAVFAPLPILSSHLRNGRKWAWLAALSNCIIVALAGGQLSLIFYVVFIVALSLSLPELLKLKISLEKSTVLTLLAMALSGALFVFGDALYHHLNPILEIKKQVSGFVDLLGQSIASGSGVTGLLNAAEVDEWKRSLLVEFPSIVAVFSLVLVWANLVLLLRANPNQMRESLGLDVSFLKKWKAPDYLVWPTIVTGFFLIFNAGVVSNVSLNVFKFLMAIYAIQGLSILTYFFDLWGIRGFFRIIGFSIAVFLMTPVILSLGFFDLWFDFRSRFKQ
ncbi:MAG: DUF2232 domain-containing protein [Bdellovibrionia bacterium]